MLPVTHGIAYTKRQILLYTILLVVVTVLPYLTGMSGLIYLISALVLGAIFLWYAINIITRPKDMQIAWKTFTYSINYLMLIFLALLVDHYWLITTL